MRAATVMKSKAILDPAEIPLKAASEHPRYRALAGEIEQFEKRLRQAEQREAVAEARSRGQEPTVSLADRAKALLAGGSVMVNAPAAELAAAREERQVLHRAIIAKREELEAVKGELATAEAYPAFLPTMEDACRMVDAALEALFTGLEIGRVCRARLLAGGYPLLDASLPIHMLPAAAVLGNPRQSGTIASNYRQWCRARGIVRD